MVLLLLELGKDTFPLFLVHIEVLLRHIALHCKTFVKQVHRNDLAIIFLMAPCLNNVINVGNQAIVSMLFIVKERTVFTRLRLFGVFTTIVFPDKLYFILGFGCRLFEI